MIPYVTHDAETIRLYTSPEHGPTEAVFAMDPEEARELVTMLVGSIARIEGGTERLTILFDALLDRYKRTGDTADTGEDDPTGHP